MTYSDDMIALVDQRIGLASKKDKATGTIISRDSTGPGAMVLFDGATTAMPVKVVGNVFARPGDRVVLDKYGSDWLVTSSFTAQGLGESSWLGFGPPSGTALLTSSSYIDFSDIAPIPFAKAYDNTYVRMGLSGSCYRSVVVDGTAVRFAFRVIPVDSPGYTATDYPLNQVILTDTNARPSTYHVVRWLGIPAGSYSIQLRWRRAAGNSSLRADGNDMFSMELDEGIRSGNPVL